MPPWDSNLQSQEASGRRITGEEYPTHNKKEGYLDPSYLAKELSSKTLY